MKRIMDVNQVCEYQRAGLLFRRIRHPEHGAAFADACKDQIDSVLEAGASKAIEAKCG